MAEAASFFTDGDAYERLMGRWSRAVGEEFIDWLAQAKGLRWLDVGCGTGAFTELVMDRCAPSHVSAIDPSEDQIAFARRCPAAGRATFISGDAQALPFKDGEFDVAAMALVISFVPDAPKAVAEMRRVVGPGGMAATYMWDGMGGGFVQQPLIDALAAMNVDVSTPARKNSTITTLRDFFEKAGFKQVSTCAIEIEVAYASFEDYWASQTGLVNPTVQAVRTLSQPDLERLKAGLQEKLTSDSSGRIAYPARANAVKGWVAG